MVKSKGEGPASRGIPSRRALLLNYNKPPMPWSARWEKEDVLKLVFPPELQEAQYGIALKLVSFLSSKESANGDELAGWAQDNGVPNSTLRNLVIPKMIRVGLLARERVNPTGQGDKDKRHRMVLKLSKRFGEAMQHAGREWNSLVETWRVKRKKLNG